MQLAVCGGVGRHFCSVFLVWEDQELNSKKFFWEISVKLSHFFPHTCSHYCSLRPVMITVKSAGRTASMQFVKSKI